MEAHDPIQNIGLVREIGQWGIAGLFFIMWWLERREKFQHKADAMRMTEVAEESAKREKGFINVVVDNTKAMTELIHLIRSFLRKSGIEP